MSRDVPTEAEPAARRLQVEFEFTLGDLLAFNDYQSVHWAPLRRQMRLRRVVFLVAALVVWLVFAAQPRAGLAVPAGVVCAALVAAYWLAVPRLARRSTRRAVARLYAAANAPSLFGLRQMTITPGTLTQAGELAVTTYKWIAIDEIVVDTDHVFFYVGPAQALVLPKAAFLDEGAFEEFVSTAQRYHREARQGINPFAPGGAAG